MWPGATSTSRRAPSADPTRCFRIVPSEEHYTLKEVHALLRRPDCPVMVWTALYTGMRKGELCGLRKAEEIGRAHV